MPRPRGDAQQIIAVSAVPPARTRPQGFPRVVPTALLPPVRTSPAAPPVPPPPSLRHPSPADSSGVPGQRRERLAGEMETETDRQREEEQEGFPIPEKLLTPAVKRRELPGSGGFLALLNLRSCCCPGGRRGQNRRRVQRCRALPWEECAL